MCKKDFFAIKKLPPNLAPLILHNAHLPIDLKFAYMQGC